MADGGMFLLISISLTNLVISQQSPFFSKPRYSFTVAENSPVYTTIGQIKPNGTFTQLKLLGSTDFTIESPTGNVLTNGDLDYERRSSYELLVVTSGENTGTSSATVTVNIADVNEAPHFVMSSYTATVVSNSAVGTRVLTTTAWDVDAGPSGVLMYSIVPQSPNFNINIATGLITVATYIDMTGAITFTVQAQDQGTPPLSASTKVIIMVVSSAEETTKMPESQHALPKYSFDVTVLENTPIGTNLLNLKEYIPNDVTSYSLTGVGSEKFTLSSDKQLRVAGHLDFEEQRFFDVMVKPPESTTVLVNIRLTLQDRNDFPPMFFGILSPFRVPFNVTVGQVLYTVSAWDGDARNTENSRVTYSIASGRSDVFSINSTTGDIVTTQTLDVYVTYLLKLQASDNGNPSLRGYTDIEISTFDPSVRFPIFHSEFEVVSITENAFALTSVFSAKASVNGEENAVSYSLIGSTAQQQFFIDPITGVVTNLVIFDRETSERTAFIVRATNKADVSRNTDLMVNVLILDVNDNPPAFPFKFNSADVVRNALEGTIVFRPQAFDVDNNSQLNYTILNGNTEALFDLINGEVVLAKRISNSTLNNFDLTLKVNDGLFSDTTHLLISVQETS